MKKSWWIVIKIASKHQSRFHMKKFYYMRLYRSVAMSQWSALSACHINIAIGTAVNSYSQNHRISGLLGLEGTSEESNPFAKAGSPKAGYIQDTFSRSTQGNQS